MEKFSIDVYEGSHERWDHFVHQANEGTLFHLLSFLEYHQNKFAENEHHLAIHKGEALYGVIPMGIFTEGRQRIAKSPYGASYGGPVFLKALNYSDSMETVLIIIEYLQKENITSLTMTLPIAPAYRVYSDTFRLALYQKGFVNINRDISSVVSLDRKNGLFQMLDRRLGNIARKARKARKAGIESVSHACFKDFWKVLEATSAKHQARPTHSKEELEWIHQRLPEWVYFDVAYYRERPIAGIALFVINDLVTSSFYLAQNPEFQQFQGLSLLIYEALLHCQAKGFKWFDFGTSSFNMKGREAIFRFKESFGAVGFFRDTYSWRKAGMR
jgi:hypothetical protein